MTLIELCSECRERFEGSLHSELLVCSECYAKLTEEPIMTKQEIRASLGKVSRRHFDKRWMWMIAALSECAQSLLERDDVVDGRQVHDDVTRLFWAAKHGKRIDDLATYVYDRLGEPNGPQPDRQESAEEPSPTAVTLLALSQAWNVLRSSDMAAWREAADGPQEAEDEVESEWLAREELCTQVLWLLESDAPWGESVGKIHDLVFTHLKHDDSLSSKTIFFDLGHIFYAGDSDDTPTNKERAKAVAAYVFDGEGQGASECHMPFPPKRIRASTMATALRRADKARYAKPTKETTDGESSDRD